MSYQSIFKRYELKFMLTTEQKARLLDAMAPYMALDDYGRSSIRNLYFDTPDYRLIRRSLERPVYKEKLRIRSYGPAEGNDPVFVELKKKYNSVVYKRRVSLSERDAMGWLVRGDTPGTGCQIGREIDYFRGHYAPLAPTVCLSYAREAYFQRDGGDFRVTFDDDILCRLTHLSLAAPLGGHSLLPEGQVLMEVKCSGGIPLWLTRFLTAEGIRKTSFSKYGTAYQTLIYPNRTGDHHHV